MPKITCKTQHTLGEMGAIVRLKENCTWAHAISDLKENWSNNRMDFTVSIQGVMIRGRIEVTDSLLLFEGSLPLIAIPFKSWIPAILKNALKPRNSTENTTASVPTETLLLYLHIPKAGGTTLGEFIYNQCRNDDNNNEPFIKNGVFFTADGFFKTSEATSHIQMETHLKRDDLRAVIGHFSFGIHKFLNRPFHYITILREPVSRVISLYHYLKLEIQISLQEFAESCPYPEIDNDQTRRIAGVNPKIGKCSVADLQMAKDNLRQHFEVVGTTERFDETVALLKRKFNWNKEFATYPRNVNTYQKGDFVHSKETTEAIINRNLFDIELHRYANQLMNEQIAASEISIR